MLSNKIYLRKSHICRKSVGSDVSNYVSSLCNYIDTYFSLHSIQFLLSINLIFTVTCRLLSKSNQVNFLYAEIIYSIVHSISSFLVFNSTDQRPKFAINSEAQLRETSWITRSTCHLRRFDQEITSPTDFLRRRKLKSRGPGNSQHRSDFKISRHFKVAPLLDRGRKFFFKVRRAFSSLS